MSAGQDILRAQVAKMMEAVSLQNHEIKMLVQANKTMEEQLKMTNNVLVAVVLQEGIEHNDEVTLVVGTETPTVELEINGGENNQVCVVVRKPVAKVTQ